MFERIQECLIRNSLWLSIAIGSLLLMLHYNISDKIGWPKELSKILGTTIISGGVFMSISKAIQFTGIFKQELEKIVFGDRFLDQKSDDDLLNIWSVVSYSLYRKKFPEISTKIHDIITNNYLPIADKSYFSRYLYDIRIVETSDDHYLKFVERTECTLKSYKKNEQVKYTFSSSINMTSEDDIITSYDLKSITVNGKSEDISNLDGAQKSEKEGSDNKWKLIFKHEIQLSGADDYKIVKEEEKVYSMKVNSKTHNATRIYDSPEINVYYPKTLTVGFKSAGTVNKFAKEKTEVGEDTMHMRLRYDGLIFYSQGFILLFDKC